MENKLTVFITTYNRSAYLEECIESVLAQSYKEFELVILDNCSTDNTEEIVNKFSDERIKYLKQNRNIGGINNIKYAFETVESEFFVVFHDDDRMKHNFLEEELNYLEKNKRCACVSCNATVMDFLGREKDSYLKESNNVSVKTNEEVFKEYIRDRKVYVFPSFMYRTKVIREFDITIREEVGPCADVVLYSQIALSGYEVAELPQELIGYRMHEKQDSFMNRDAMCYQLFDFLKSDEKFSCLLSKYKNEQHSYFKIVRGGIIEDYMYGVMDKKGSITRLREYSLYIDYKQKDLYVGILTIKIASMLGNFMRRAYKMYVSRRNK